MTDRYNGIGEPDDLPAPHFDRDPDTLPDRGGYVHTPITWEALDAVIRAPNYEPGFLTRRQAS